LFLRNRAAAEDVDAAGANRDDGRFDSMSGRTTVDNQRDSILQIIKNMLRGCRANAAEAVCTGRRERFSKRLNNFGENRMHADSNGYGGQACSYNFGNDFPFRQNHRKRSWPTRIGQFQEQLSILRGNIDNFFQPLAIGQMND